MYIILYDPYLRLPNDVDMPCDAEFGERLDSSAGGLGAQGL